MQINTPSDNWPRSLLAASLKPLIKFFSKPGFLDLDGVLSQIRELIECGGSEVCDASKREEKVGVEERVVFDNGGFGERLHKSERGNSEHSVTTLGDLKLSHGLASVGIVTEHVVKASRVEVVISGNTEVPDLLHVGTVLFSEFCSGSSAVPSEEFKGGEGAKECQDGTSRDRVNSVQYRWSTASFQHEIGTNKLRKRPANNCQHSKTGVTDFAFLHVVQVEILGQSQWVESEVTGMASIQVGGFVEEGKSDGLVDIVVSTTVE